MKTDLKLVYCFGSWLVKMAQEKTRIKKKRGILRHKRGKKPKERKRLF